MNKKGSLFHWIIFGIVAALGLFVLLTTDIKVKSLEGEWQFNFLETYYLNAEADLLKTDQEIKSLGWEAMLELGETGGSISEGKCGKVEGYNLWSTADDWCWPDMENNFLAKVKSKLKQKLPGRSYSGIQIDGEDLVGDGEERSIVSSSFNIPFLDYVKYTYDTSFRVPLGFDLKQEYKGLRAEATKLMDKCEGHGLEECVTEKKDKSWKFKDCAEEYVEERSKVLFCVESKHKVWSKEGTLVPIKYKFALDFTSP
ncbi:hypothetical protein GOV03_02585 [Candidatus Woesearchaeota archaeon]|nr:hypothetical protein [Candidatus Woesearchaeota archaeon]